MYFVGINMNLSSLFLSLCFDGVVITDTLSLKTYLAIIFT